MSRLSEDENDRRAKKAAEQITLHDLERVRLSRGTLAEMTSSPAFEEYVVGQSRVVLAPSATLSSKPSA